MTKSYILADEIDGRTLKIVHRVSTLSLARRHARAFANQSYDGFDLIELRDGGERRHIQYYEPRAQRGQRRHA